MATRTPAILTLRTTSRRARERRAEHEEHDANDHVHVLGQKRESAERRDDDRDVLILMLN
jgi:hypothetical protein